jgi:hypothetical protein
MASSVWTGALLCAVFTADGGDLVEFLVRDGLARIYGTRTRLPDGRDSREFLAHLSELEAQAKTARRGGWGKAKFASPEKNGMKFNYPRGCCLVAALCGPRGTNRIHQKRSDHCFYQRKTSFNLIAAEMAELAHFVLLPCTEFDHCAPWQSRTNAEIMELIAPAWRFLRQTS